jgi:Glycogen recognition site of AMP-activated protein kinase
MRPEPDVDSEQAFAERVAAQIRGPVPLSDRVEREVMARIQGERRDGGTRVRIARRGRPLLATLGLAAGIVLVFGLGVLVGRQGATPGIGGVERRSVEFVLRTTASSVAVVGDFNDWDPHATPLRPSSDSLWSVVVPLRPGRYHYTFVVDGTRWRRDPGAPRALEDDFGTPTSVITVAQR